MRKGKDLHVVHCVILSSDSITHQTLPGMQKYPRILQNADSSTRVGISGTTAKSCQRKFVPSSHPGHFALVASSHKSQTKVGTLACFDVLKKNEQTM